MFVDIEGSVKPRPRFQTRTKMLWDDHFFYVGAELEEPHVWATLTEHDSVIFRGNDFELIGPPDRIGEHQQELVPKPVVTGTDNSSLYRREELRSLNLSR